MLSRLVRVFSILGLMTLASALIAGAQSVSFVQITDPHLYDAGNHLLPAGVREEILENRDALDWAILQTNRIEDSGRHLDFVVITGDFGLDTPASRLGPGAIDQLAITLGALLVDPILVVPGNNDLVDEKPADIKRFQQFIVDLRAKLPSHTIVDLSQQAVVINHIRLLGLNSASFKNSDGKDKETNRPAQLQEMQRLAGEIQKDEPHIIFTHIPHLEDPFRGPTGKDIHDAWQVDKSVSDLWNTIASSKEVVAVFAGHFHDPRRGVYGQDYSWTEHKPNPLIGSKTWIAPPLAAKFQRQSNPQARGLLVATVLSTGKVSADIIWLPSATPAPAPTDKADYLIEGAEYAKDEEWDRAAQAYRQALQSSDPATREIAQKGYETAGSHTRRDPYQQSVTQLVLHFLWHHALDLLLAALLVGLIIWLVRKMVRKPYDTSKPPIVLLPTKYSPDAPIELFAAEMIVSAEEIRETFSAAGGNPYIRFAAFPAFAQPSPTFQAVIASIPDVKGVNLGKFVGFFVNLYNYFSWHVDSGIATQQGRAIGIAFLRRAWRTESVLRASGTISGPIDTLNISRELAYNIVGLAFLDRR
jgi:3',5'-cyclic AMP phosphodiesterase CpdA